jgi:hypothetical protein
MVRRKNFCVRAVRLRRGPFEVLREGAFELRIAFVSSHSALQN